jgi:hypothetical protein
MPEEKILKEENQKDHPAWAEFVAWFEELYVGNHPDAVPFLNIQNWEPYLAGYNAGHNAGFQFGFKEAILAAKEIKDAS